MKKRIICFVIVLIMAVGLFPSAAFATTYPLPSPEDSPTSGSLSETVTWEYDRDTATLFISGNGEMPVNTNPEWLGHARDIKHIVIEDGITAISKSAFGMYYRAVQTVSIPDSVTVIGNYAFAECFALESITIPSSVTTIGESAFYNCTALKSVVISDGVTQIRFEAFAGCTALDSITLPDSITIGGCAFDNTAYYNNPDNWKDGVLYIGNILITANTISGKYEILPGTTGIANGAFIDCTLLEEVVIPEGITKISTNAFSGCTALKSMALPDSITEIKQSAFYYCTALESISLPYSLTVIEGGAFTMCTALTDVYYDGSRFDFLQRVTVDPYDSYFDNVTFHYTVELYNTSEIFNDIVKTKWYSVYTDYAHTHGLFNGTSDTTFEPNAPLTRAMFVTVLWRISGNKTDINTKTKFSDVETGKWYTAAVAWAAENGMVNGLSDTLFGTNENITREQMCTMLVRFAEHKNITFETVNENNIFNDESEMSSWAKDAIYACQAAGIVNGSVNGYGNPVFKPKDNATRAEASKILSVFHYDYIS